MDDRGGFRRHGPLKTLVRLYQSAPSGRYNRVNRPASEPLLKMVTSGTSYKRCHMPQCHMPISLCSLLIPVGNVGKDFRYAILMHILARSLLCVIAGFTHKMHADSASCPNLQPRCIQPGRRVRSGIKSQLCSSISPKTAGGVSFCGLEGRAAVGKPGIIKGEKAKEV